MVTVTAEDPDAITSPYGQLVYTLTNNNDNKFNIDPDNGKITVAGSLDAEETSEYILVIQAKEIGGTNSATVSCIVTVSDVNDNKPLCTKYSFSRSVPESIAVPADIVTLDCSDKDITRTLQYTISIGDTTLFGMNQSVLQLKKEVDYDTSPPLGPFNIIIDVSDGTNHVQVSGVVTISGVNEAQPIFTQGMLKVLLI